MLVEGNSTSSYTHCSLFALARKYGWLYLWSRSTRFNVYTPGYWYRTFPAERPYPGGTSLQQTSFPTHRRCNLVDVWASADVNRIYVRMCLTGCVEWIAFLSMMRFIQRGPGAAREGRGSR